MEPNFIGAPQDTVNGEQMPALRSHHRRAFSEFPVDVAGGFDDDMLFDPLDFFNPDFTFPVLPPSPSLPDIPEMAFGANELDGSGSSFEMSGSLIRSLPNESDDLIGAIVRREGGGGGEKKAEHRRRHSVSVDGSSMMSFRGGPTSYLMKKAMPPEQLAELKRVDPVRARRIVANRESAARSKLRRSRYLSEMEKKLRDLHMQSTNLTQCILTLKDDTTNLSTRQVKLQTNIQSMIHHSQIQNDVEHTIKHDLDFLREETVQTAVIIANGGVGMQDIPNPPPHLQAPQQPQLFPPSLPPHPPFGQLNDGVGMQDIPYPPPHLQAPQQPQLFPPSLPPHPPFGQLNDGVGMQDIPNPPPHLQAPQQPHLFPPSLPPHPPFGQLNDGVGMQDIPNPPPHLQAPQQPQLFPLSLPPHPPFGQLNDGVGMQDIPNPPPHLQAPQQPQLFPPSLPPHPPFGQLNDGVGMQDIPNPPPHLQAPQQPQLFPPSLPPLPPFGQDFSGHFGPNFSNYN